MKLEEVYAENKVYAYKLNRKIDGSIYLYILRFADRQSAYHSFHEFYDSFLRLCDGKTVIYSPPPVAPDGKAWDEDENFERVGYSEQEANRLEEYKKRKRIFFWR